MTTTEQILIGGETVTDLVEAIRGIKLGPGKRGRVEVTGQFGPAATRALMRLEAELLIADADALAGTGRLDRTEGQRRADAFVQLGRELQRFVVPAQ